jgi:hypothetical protein
MSEKKWERTSPDDGYRLCPRCLGRGWCKSCDGTGRLLADPSQRCVVCAGKGDCMVCDATGQLPEGHYALTDWKDDAKP